MDNTENPYRGTPVSSLLESIDWANTSLGPRRDWPECLKSTLNLMLPSYAQIVLFWGKDYIAFYNDAYATTIGEKHPAAFGRPACENWSELWDDLKPLLDRVRLDGDTVAGKDRPFYIERYGHPECVYFDISYSPVLSDAGEITGVLCIVEETTRRVLLEDNLKKSQDQLDCALDAAGMVGLFDWDIRNDLVRADARFSEFFGIEPERAQEGVPMAEFMEAIHPQDRIRVQRAVDHIKMNGEKFAEEYRVLRPDGTVLWIDAHGRCLFSATGEPLRFAGAVIDITARRRTEDALRESEERLKAIFDQTAGGIVQMDVSGCFSFVNDRYGEIVGYTKDELRGMGVQALIHPDDLDRSLEALAGMLRTGQSFEIEKRYRRKDGSTVWVHSSVNPIHDRSGAIVQAVATVFDITQRKQAEEHAKSLAAIIASSDDAIISSDLDMTIRSWNEGAMRLYGYSAKEILGQSINVLVPEGRKREAEDIMRQITRGERVETHETRRRRKDGTIIEVSLTVSPVFDEQGRIIGASKIARDITAQKEAERLTHVLMGELQHRIKNVLATVQAVARQTFSRGGAKPGQIDTFVARLAALGRAHDLLTVSSWQDAELSAVVRETLSPYASARLSVEGPGLRLPPRSAVAMALALHELATNAAKYGALSVPNGQVAIQWTVDGAAPSRFDLLWRERGGPPVSLPSEKGFGSKLITSLLAAELGGSVNVDYGTEGLECRVSAPLDTRTAVLDI